MKQANKVFLSPFLDENENFFHEIFSFLLQFSGSHHNSAQRVATFEVFIYFFLSKKWNLREPHTTMLLSERDTIVGWKNSAPAPTYNL